MRSFVVAMLLTACEVVTPASSTDATVRDASATDASTTDGSPTDATTSDANAAASRDAGPADAASSVDASMATDAFLPVDAHAPEDAFTPGPDAFAAPTDAWVAPRDAATSRCGDVSFFGSCITRSVSSAAVLNCTEYELSPDYPSASTYEDGCPASSAALIRTWETTRCPHATAVVGCRVVYEAPSICYVQNDWYYPPATRAERQAACEHAGRTILEP